MAFSLPFESTFNHGQQRAWFARHWSWSITISIVYITSIFTIKYVMVNRPAYSLRLPLAAWSSLLAIFSTIGTFRTISELIFVLYTEGPLATICSESNLISDPVSGFWHWAFVVSKAFELGDTVFVVLRKQKLTYLHWCHHWVTLTYCWFSYGQSRSVFRNMTVMNYTVHSVMYTYYALKAFGVRINSTIASTVTSLQLIQMVFGLIFCTFALVFNSSCQTEQSVAALGLVIYVALLVLFANFYVKSYLTLKEKTKIN